MTEEFAIGLIVALAIGQLFAWVGYWHWHSETKYLRMMWKHELEMNNALFSQLTEEKRPKKFLVDSALMSQLSDEEREAVLMANMSDEEREKARENLKSSIEAVENGRTIYPFMAEEPLPPETILHQEGEDARMG